MSRPTADRVHDALGAMDLAERFVQGVPTDFDGDDRALYAVLYCFVVIGEALRHVPEAVRVSHSGVPWRDMIGMRNRIAHDYLGIDRVLVWRTVCEEFPLVRPLLQDVLTSLEG